MPLTRLGLGLWFLADDRKYVPLPHLLERLDTSARGQLWDGPQDTADDDYLVTHFAMGLPHLCAKFVPELRGVESLIEL